MTIDDKNKVFLLAGDKVEYVAAWDGGYGVNEDPIPDIVAQYTGTRTSQLAEPFTMEHDGFMWCEYDTKTGQSRIRKVQYIDGTTINFDNPED